MKNKKFMLGLATSTVVIPLVGMMTGCTQQNITSNVINLAKANNKMDGKYNLTIYLEGDTKFGVLGEVIPEELSEEYSIDLPELIINHGKELDLDRIEDGQGWWNYTGDDQEQYSIGYDDARMITIKNESHLEAGDIDVHLPLKNIDEDHNIENCSWTDFLYWYNTCELHGKHNLKDFKAMFGLPTNKDSLVGIERTLEWSQLSHKVRIVDTGENFENHSKLYYAPEDGKELLDEGLDPKDLGERVGLTFQFVNVLTKKTKEGNQIWKTQWHQKALSDWNFNCWAETYGEPGEPYYYMNEKSKLRTHLREQKNFLDKFENEEFVNSIKPVYIRRFGQEAYSHDQGLRNWFKEKFFIASGHQMGLPKRGDPGAPSWEYYIEPDEECQTFAYWTNHKDKDSRKFYRVGRHEGDKSEQIWVASPCNEGGGTFSTEHVFEIDFDGSWNHVAMHHERDILPCFCL